MPDYSRITVFILTPLIFRYHLPLKSDQDLDPDPHCLVRSRMEIKSWIRIYIETYEDPQHWFTPFPEPQKEIEG